MTPYEKLDVAIRALTEIAGKPNYADDPWQIAKDALHQITACPNCGGSEVSTLDAACVECGSER